jgi:DNA-binding XRE family transcriptional regulator
MGIVLYHPCTFSMGSGPPQSRQRRECSRECSVASVSSVMPFTSRWRAKSTKSSQRSAGMDLRAFQDETVDAVVPQYSATSPVPPSASIISSQFVSMPPITRRPRESQVLTTGEKKVSLEPAKIRGMADQRKVVARRLTMTRKALGFDGWGGQSEFCRQLGIETNVYNPFEKGTRKITLEVAEKICDRFGVSLDWIYRGNPALLPVEVYRKLAEVA